MPRADVVIRTATRTDASAIADVLNAHSRALFGESDLTAATVEGWFELPRVVWFALAELGGRAVGYADLQQNAEHADIDARTIEDVAAEPLVVACTERALATLPVRGYAPSVDEAAAAAYRAAGFTVVRHAFTMLIDLGTEQPAPAWPDGVTVRAWREGDDPVVHATLQEAFAQHFGFTPTPYDEWLRSTETQPGSDRALWFVAAEGDEVAGAAVCAWHSSGDPTFGWVESLGVRTRWRRRGLGLALLRHAFAEFAARGATRVGLGVDAENTTGAVRLYERAGMRVTRRYDTWELAR